MKNIRLPNKNSNNTNRSNQVNFVNSNNNFNSNNNNNNNNRPNRVVFSNYNNNYVNLNQSYANQRVRYNIQQQQRNHPTRNYNVNSLRYNTWLHHHHTNTEQLDPEFYVITRLNYAYAYATNPNLSNIIPILSDQLLIISTLFEPIMVHCDTAIDNKYF